MFMTIRIADASPAVLRAVLAICSEERHNIPEWLQEREDGWAPQVHLSGSRNGEPLFAIITPKLNAEAATAVSFAARDAEAATPRATADAAAGESQS